MVHGHEGGGSHGVPYVEQILLASHLQDLVNSSRYIIASHLIPRKLPELSLVKLCRNQPSKKLFPTPCIGMIQVGMVSAVGIATKVSHPNITASISQNESCKPG